MSSVLLVKANNRPVEQSVSVKFYESVHFLIMILQLFGIRDDAIQLAIQTARNF